MEEKVEKVDLRASKRVEVELIQDLPSLRKKKGDKFMTLKENVKYLKAKKLIK